MIECAENPYISMLLAHMGVKPTRRKTWKYRFAEISP